MKALLWKELRQLAPWGSLMWLAAVAVTASLMYDEFNSRQAVRLFANDLFAFVAFGSAGIALVLGLLQTALEVRRDQWAFLLHRGLSATQVFLAKVLAGMLVYAAVTFTSVIIAVTWARAGGVEQYPFSWYQTLSILAAIAAAPAFYFAALLTVVWKGPWYISRLLPLVAPGLLMLGVLWVVLEVTEYVPPLVFAGIVLADGILAVAAWGIFVRSGEAAGRPRWGAVCLGVPLFVAVGCALGSTVVASAVVYEWCLYEVFKRDRVNVRGAWHFANREGHVCRLVTSPGPNDNTWDARIASITDLDQPESNRYAPLVGTSVSMLNQPEKVPAWDPLATSGVWYIYDHPVARMFGRFGRTAVLENLGQTNVPGGSRNWIFSSDDGWIYEYVNEVEIRGGRPHEKPPRLTHVAGPDGFTDSAHRPARQFRRLLESSATFFRRSTTAWPDLAQASPYNANDIFLLCDDGLYVVDMAKREVRQELVARDGRRIRSLVPFGDDVAVVYNDLVSVHAARVYATGEHRKNIQGEDEEVTLNPPGEALYSFPLPKEITNFDRFEMGRLPGQEIISFRAAGPVGTHTRFLTMKLNGAIMRVRDVSNEERMPSEGLPVLCGVALFLPAGPLFLALGYDAADQVSAETGSGVLVWMFRQSPAETTLFLIALFGSACFCRWSATRTARRYGFEPGTRRAWQWIAFLLGPAGLLTLWLLRDWPALEPCAVCSNRRPVDRENCPHCGQPVPRPTPSGTEIILFGDQPTDSPVAPVVAG